MTCISTRNIYIGRCSCYSTSTSTTKATSIGSTVIVALCLCACATYAAILPNDTIDTIGTTTGTTSVHDTTFYLPVVGVSKIKTINTTASIASSTTSCSRIAAILNIKGNVLDQEVVLSNSLYAQVVAHGCSCTIIRCCFYRGIDINSSKKIAVFSSNT